MEIRSDFEVPASVDDTYGLLIDLERVAPCIPGGEVGPEGEDGAHPASIAIKLGPMRMTYKGTVRIDDRSDAEHRAVLVADVREARGQGSAKARMTMEVARGGPGSSVETVTDVKLTGRAAQMGRGVVDDVAARLVKDMAECIAARLTPTAQAGSEAEAAPPASGAAGAPQPAAVRPALAKPPPPARAAPAAAPAKPIGGIGLLLRALSDRIKRILGRNHNQD